jgi:histone deacetylase 1/2
MENANSKEYLEKIKIQVIENLKQTAHAPSIQMTDVPRTTITGGTDEDDDILDDLDEDDNKDVRSTKRRWDQRITRDDELDESDDEEQARANGVHKQNGANKRRNHADVQNPNAVASDVEMDGGVITPEVRQEVDAIVAALASEANAEINAEVMEQKSRSLTVTAAESGEVGPSNAPSGVHSPRPAFVDPEGDVEMSELRETLFTGFPARNHSPSPAAAAATAPNPGPQVPISPAASIPTSVPATTESITAAAPPPERTEIKKESDVPATDGDMIM